MGFVQIQKTNGEYETIHTSQLPKLNQKVKMTENKNTDSKLQGQVRHTLGALGGALVAFGVASQGDLDSVTTAIVSIAGGIGVLVAMFHSWKSKDK